MGIVAAAEATICLRVSNPVAGQQRIAASFPVNQTTDLPGFADCFAAGVLSSVLRIQQWIL